MKSKKLINRLSLILILISMSGFTSLGCNIIGTEQYYGEINSIKSSDNEITIATPENKTYSAPMSGYYPATYGFENDMIGSVPQGWFEDSLGTGVVEVIQQEDQHKNVLHIQSGSSPNNQGNAKLTFPDLATGTLEYWIKFDNVDPPAFYIYAAEIEDGTDAKVVVRIVSNGWKYYDGSTYQSICPAEANKWYRLRVDWNLNSDTSDIYVYYANNTLAGSVIGAMNAATGTAVNHLAITMYNSVTNTNIWVDAVGVSWDPDYSLGDNIQEGLMLGFMNSTALDWMGFSLDGLANKTILGNTTITMLADGPYNIQVFGNDSLGTMYQSELRHFTIDTTPPEISIISPTVGQEFSSPPSFTLSITEENIASTWYTLNGGSTIPFSGESGVIDSTAWNALANGNITIRFYVQDMADRLDFDEVEVIKESQEIPPEIPGYNLILLIGV
ncbi:MAG: hypothetical protein WBH31_07750, partial [Promethearchaeia archaeon]